MENVDTLVTLVEHPYTVVHAKLLRNISLSEALSITTITFLYATPNLELPEGVMYSVKYKVYPANFSFGIPYTDLTTKNPKLLDHSISHFPKQDITDLLEFPALARNSIDIRDFLDISGRDKHHYPYTGLSFFRRAVLNYNYLSVATQLELGATLVFPDVWRPWVGEKT